jgi:hypothetical protein
LLDSGWVSEQTPRNSNDNDNDRDEARVIDDGLGTRRN